MLKKPLVKCVCYFCKKEFERKSYEVNRNKREGRKIFCSKYCAVQQSKLNNIKETEYVCQQCGMSFMRKRRNDKEQKFCSLSCHALYFNTQRRKVLDAKYNKETLEAKVKSYIKGKGEYCTEATILRDCEIPYDRWASNRFKARDLNASVGIYLHPERAKAMNLIREGKILNIDDLRMLTGLQELRGLNKLIVSFGYTPESSFERKLKTLKDDIISYIKSVNHQVSVSHILEEFNIDFNTYKSLDTTIPDLCKLAGVKYAATLSYHECWTVNFFRSKGLIVETQKCFDGCVNPATNRRLRFDIYLPELSAIVEVDGSHHFKESNSYGTYEEVCKKDEIKKVYAESNNISLYRIPIKPKSTFKQRANELYRKLDGCCKTP